MGILQEIRAFLETITDWAVLLVVFTFFFFTCNIETVSVFGRETIIPVPSEIPFAAEVFTIIQEDIAPPSIELVVMSPMAAFVIQVKLALMMAIFFTFPVFLLRLLNFLAPALYAHERRLLYLLVTPLSVLFLGGAAFAYVYIAPATLRILYGFSTSIGATPLLGAGEFIGITVALLFVTGMAFTIPVFMVLLTAFKAVRASFWFTNARYAIVFFLITSAIITPDGSGVSMLLMSLPVSVLYGVGSIVSSHIERGEDKTRNTAHTKFNH